MALVSMENHERRLFGYAPRALTINTQKRLDFVGPVGQVLCRDHVLKYGWIEYYWCRRHLHLIRLYWSHRGRYL